jgi:hypothetical protein
MGPPYRRYDHSSSVINGMPEPSLLGFLPNETPPLIDVCCCHVLELNTHLAWIQALDCQIVDVLELRRCFLTLP